MREDNQQTLAECVIDNICELDEEAKEAFKKAISDINSTAIPRIEWSFYEKNSKLILSLNVNQAFESEYMPLFIGKFIIHELTENVYKEFLKVTDNFSKENPFIIYINANKETRNISNLLSGKKEKADFYKLEIADTGSGFPLKKMYSLLEKLTASYRIEEDEKLLSVEETKLIRKILAPEKRGNIGLVGLFNIIKNLKGTFELSSNYSFDSGKLFCDKLRFPVIGERVNAKNREYITQNVMNNKTKTAIYIEIPELSLKKFDDIIMETQKIQRIKYKKK